MNLSIANIEFLKKEIGKAGLTYSHLQDDMVDHVCCDVEYEMQSGLSFEKAYELVKKKIGIGGLMRIQEETLFLIDKNYRIMKKLMKISGLVAPIMLAFGALFKIEHWPGAGIMLVLGFFLLSVVFLPSAIYVSYKEVSNQTKKLAHLMGFFGTFFLSLSFLFKIMHWPGTGILLLLGAVLTCLVFLPIVIYHRFKDKEIKIPRYIFVLAISGLMVYILAFAFKMMHWPGAAIMFFAGCTLFIFLALPLYVFKTYKDNPFVENSFIYIILVTIWIVMPTTLLSLNVSSNILGEMFETDAGVSSGIHLLKDKNVFFVSKILGDKRAATIHSQSQELYDFIQQIKFDIIKITEGAQSGSLEKGNREIETWKLDKIGNLHSLNLVLFNKDKRGEKLKRLLSNYKTSVQSVCNKQNYWSLMDKTLNFDLNKEENDFEILLASLNRLSVMQMNVLQAEQAALLVISKKLTRENSVTNK